MKKTSGGFIGYNTPRFGSGTSPGGVYNQQDVIDLKKNIGINFPRDSAAQSGWMNSTNLSSGQTDQFQHMVQWGFGDCEFPKGAASDESNNNWTEQIEWNNHPTITQYTGYVGTSFFHPANRFFSRRFGTDRGSYMTFDHHQMFNYGTGDFTIEFWFKRIDVQGENHYIVSKGTGSTGWSAYINTSYQIVFEIGGSTHISELPGAGVHGYHSGLMKDVWYHVALVRRNSMVDVFINGKKSNPSQANFNDATTTQPLYIGADKGLTGGVTRGNHIVADMRISNVAVYSANFACVANVLPLTANTNLLMAMDGEPFGPSDHGSNAMPGGANTTASYAVYADPDVPFAYTRPANVASVFFNSHADYLITSSTSTNHTVGTGPFTFETWFYSTTNGANNTPIFVCSPASPNGQEIGIWQNYNGQGLTITFPNNSNSGTTSVFGISDEPRGSNPAYWGNLVSTATWHHAAITRDASNTLRFFLDGNLKYSASNITFNQSVASYVYLNADATANRGMKLAWINDPHIAQNCLYTSNFIPSTTSRPDRESTCLFNLRGNVALDWPTAAGRTANAATTVALTNYMSGRYVSWARWDGHHVPWTADPLQAQVPWYVYDTSRVERNGIFTYQRLASIENNYTTANNYGTLYQSLKPANTSLQFGTGAFTMEAWVYPMGPNETGRFFGCGNHNSTGFSFGYGQLEFGGAGTPTPRCLTFQHGGTEAVALYMPLQMYKWHHVAVVRQNTGTEGAHLYVNGYLAHRFTMTTNITAASNPLYLFQGRSPSSAYHPTFIGRMSNLRFSNVARYTPGATVLGARSFTPQFTPFDSDANTSLLLFQYAWGNGQTIGLDLGSHKMTTRLGDYTNGSSTAWSPDSQVNWSYVNGDVGADLSIWNADGNGVATGTGGPPQDFTFGTNDFSIEFFYKPWRHQGDWTDLKEPFWYGPGEPDGAYMSIIKDIKGQLVVTYGIGDNQWTHILAASRTRLWEPDQWYHVVVQRASSHLAIYVNGIREQEVKFTTNLGNCTPENNFKLLGGSGIRAAQFANPVIGYVSNFRVFNGRAAYGENGYNPLNIPVPTTRLSGEHPNCVFLSFCGPSLRDYSRNNRFWSVGGHQIRWSAWDRANGGERGDYRIVPFGPFAETPKHWRNHNFRFSSYTESDLYMCDYDQQNNQYVRRTSWIGGNQLPFTIEFWFFMQESSNAGVGILNTWLLSHSTDLASDRPAFHFRYHSNIGNGNDYGNLYCAQQGNGGPAGILEAGSQAMAAQSYHHVIWQYDPSVEGNNKHVLWINGRKKYRADDNVTFQNRGYMQNVIRGVGIASLRISQAARYNPFQVRLDEPCFNIISKGPNDYYKIDKHTAILPVTVGNFKKMGWTPGKQGVYGHVAVSSTVPSQLPGLRGSMYFGQNAVQNSGGYWAGTTPPSGFSSPTNHYHYATNTPGNSFAHKNNNYQDYTFECWFSWAGTSSPNDKYLFEYSNNWSIRILSNNIYFRTSNSDTYQRSTGVALASSSSNRVFQHLVWQRKNGSFEIYIDGQWVTSHPASYWYSDWGSANPPWAWTENTNDWYWSIGKDQADTSSTCWLGNIADARFTYGIARYDRGVVNGQECMVLRNTSIPVLANTSLGINSGTYTQPFLAGQYETN